MKTKRMTRVLVMVLVLAMVLSVSALAAWPVYGGNDNHNAVVDIAPTSTTPSVTKIGLLNAGSGWDGVDNVPVMQTVGTTTYAYVLYDGHADGCTLAKINCSASTPAIVWQKQLETAKGFQLSTPLLVPGADDNRETDDVIYAASNSGSVYKITGLEASSATGVTATVIYSGAKGQINTPLTTYDGYLYFGTWVGNGTIDGSREPGRYYQIDLATGAVQTVLSKYKGFYWAGAVKPEGSNYIYFGGDGGNLYYRPVGDGFGSTASTEEEINAYCVTLPDVSENAPGDVRSTVMTKDGKLYFTSKGSGNGNFYCFTIGSDGKPVYSWGAKLGGTCTSTPAIADSGNIYVGYYSGFSAGGLQKVTAPTEGKEGTVADITVKIDGVAFDQPVQCTPVVYTEFDDFGEPVADYIYFNTNSGTGAGYCFSVPVNGTNATTVWDTCKTDGNTYALGGMAIENGYAVFGNDYNNLYVVHD